MASVIRILPLLAVALTLAACKSEEKGAAPPRVVLVQTVGATGAAAAPPLNGEIRARHESNLGFRVGGKIVARLVDVGAPVKAGQALARLDPTDLQHGQQAAQAQVVVAESDLALAKAELARSADLLARQFISQSAHDVKLSLFRSAQARLDQAREQAAISRNQAGYAALAADHAGVVTAVLAEVGQVVGAGQPVVQLARSGEMEVAVAVAEADLPRILALAKRAETLPVSLWARPELALRGRVREVAAAADPLNRAYPARIALIAPPAGLALGMTASVRMPAQSFGGVLVPSAAVVNRASATQVWVVENGKTVARPVQVRGYVDQGVVVSAGLAPGDKVVVAGANLLAPGIAVTPREQTVGR